MSGEEGAVTVAQTQQSLRDRAIEAAEDFAWVWKLDDQQVFHEIARPHAEYTLHGDIETQILDFRSCALTQRSGTVSELACSYRGRNPRRVVFRDTLQTTLQEIFESRNTRYSL